MKVSITASKQLLAVLCLFFLTTVFAAAQAPGGAPSASDGGAQASGDPFTHTRTDFSPIPNSGIVSITFLGNKKIENAELQQLVTAAGLKVGGQVNASIMGPAMKAIVADYKQKGLNLTISPDIIEDPKGIAFVQFIIDEGGTKGDVSGVVSNNSILTFCDTPAAQSGASGGAPGGSGGPPPSASGKTDNTPIPEQGIVSISFVGNKKFTSEELAKVVSTTLKLGDKISGANVIPAANSIVDFYKKNGAHLNVSPNMIEDPKGIQAVQFIIDENGTKGEIGNFIRSVLTTGRVQLFCE
jgi:hypothetical protein